ncbi:MAG: signal peptidase I [Candidatus Eisenbacteria bacterium]
MTARQNDEEKTGYRFPRSREEWLAEGMAWLKSIVIVLAIFLPLNTFVVQGFRIPSGSMEDTLLIGDFLFADKLTFGPRVPFADDKRLPGLRDPKPGDIIIFKSPQSGENLIKRLVAVEGQTVEMRHKQLFIDGVAVDEPFTKHVRRSFDPRYDNFGPTVVPPGQLFFLGDNRDASQDSRVFGMVPMANVVAKADVLYFSFDVQKKLPRIGRIGRLL